MLLQGAMSLAVGTAVCSPCLHVPIRVLMARPSARVSAADWAL